MENGENLEQPNIESTEENEHIQKSYDVVGLLIGAVVGIFAAIIGLTDILMGTIMGMFFGLVIGTFIKKK